MANISWYRSQISSLKAQIKAEFEQIGNPKKSFFESISPAIAKTVLLDIGVDENEWMDVYVKLMKEEQQRKYILIDLGNDI